MIKVKVCVFVLIFFCLINNKVYADEITDTSLSIVQTKTVFEVNTNIDWFDYIEVTDELDSNPYYEIDSSLVNMNQLGEYEIFVMAKDTYGNEINKTFNVSVIDSTKPTISGIKDYVIKVNRETPNYHFTVSDNYDSNNLILEVDDSNVDITKLGNYEVFITAIDTFGNVNVETAWVHVVDTAKPTIYGVKDLTIEVYALPPDYLQGVEATDNYDDVVLVNIDSSLVNLSQIGDYQITYTAIDKSGNEAKKVATLTVADNTKPKITINRELIFKVNSKPFDYFEFVDVLDNYDENPYIEILTEFNINKEGTYDFIVKASDLFNNQAIVDTLIIIAGDELPKFDGIKNFIIEAKSKEPNYLEFVSATANYGQDLIVKVDDSEVNINKIGTYTISYTTTDAIGNKAYQEAYVFVIDSSPPLIMGTKNIEVNQGEDFNPIAGVKAIDNYDGDISEDIKVISKYNINKNGKYLINLTAIDKSGNVTETSYSLVVLGNNDYFILGGVITFGTILTIIILAVLIRKKSKE